MKLLFDTSVYIEFLHRPRSPLSELLLDHFPDTYLCAVVVAELEVGTLGKVQRRAVDRLVRRFQRVGRTVAPSFDSWWRAGAASRALGRAVLNDALILCCGVQVGAVVWTRDRGLPAVAKALGLPENRVLLVPDRLLAT
ncbi:MAG: PIN domain-containing protein [Gemmatimonadetes bacterium]|nr:PIN domain-containing protein [Gemmatimonadota bacterium]